MPKGTKQKRGFTTKRKSITNEPKKPYSRSAQAVEHAFHNMSLNFDRGLQPSIDAVQVNVEDMDLDSNLDDAMDICTSDSRQVPTPISETLPYGTGFFLFSRLPAEIRCMIWNEAAPRFVRISMQYKYRLQIYGNHDRLIDTNCRFNDDPTRYQELSGVAAACKESRYEYFRHGTLTIPRSAFTNKFRLLNPSPDFTPSPNITFLKNDVFFIEQWVMVMESNKLQGILPNLKNVTKIALLESEVRYTYMTEMVRVLGRLESLETIYMITGPNLGQRPEVVVTDAFSMKTPGQSDLPATQYLMSGYLLRKFRMEYQKLKKSGWSGRIPEIIWKMPVKE